MAYPLYSCACAACKLAGGVNKDLGTPPAQPVIVKPMTGDHRMDALLEDLSHRHALTTAKTLGAVFGKEAVANAAFAGIGLSLLDAGVGYVSLMQLAIQARLGASASAEAVVQLLYTNVIGSAPGAGELAHFSGMITSGQFTAATLGVLAADTSFNAQQIQLAGIAATGLAYT